MNIRISIFTLCICCYTWVNAQYISSVTIPDTTKQKVTDENDASVKYANTINAQDLRKHLTFLAGEQCEGRETGQPGNLKAAQYIARYFDSLKLENPVNKYMQPVRFTFSSWDDTDMYVNGKRFRHLWDYIAFPNKNADIPLLDTNQVFFMGYGIDDPKYSDYGKEKPKDLKNRVIVINNGEPMKDDKNYWISGTEQLSDWTLDKKLKVAKEKGVKFVLVIDEDIKKTVGESRGRLLGPIVELGDHSKDVLQSANYCLISTTIAKELFGKEEEKILKARKEIMKKGKSKAVKLKVDFKANFKKKVNTINSQNVMGYIEGTNKAEEAILITAHYDHLGKRGENIFYGADDNGSGTSTVMELAQAFSLAAKSGSRPLRSIAFILMTGEEKGLLGSEYYVNNAIFPIKNSVADINIDMVGRVDEKHADNPNYIYVIGSDRMSKDLHHINEDMNQKYTQLTLDYTFNDEKDPNRFYYRSDHYNFAEKGIPAIFFFNGVHPDYHQPTDTVDKINFDKMAKVGQLIFHTVWELANRGERIKVDVK